MAKFNVDKAKAGGMSDEQIEAFLAANPQLERKSDFSGNLMEDIKSNIGGVAKETIQEAAPFVREKTKAVLDKVGLPETGNTKSTALNVLAGTPRALAEIPADLLAENVTPTGLAVNALTLGAGTVAKPLLKGASKVVGKTMSGKGTKEIGKLFEDPGALVAGVKESVTGAAKKAFGKAKELTGIRQVKRGAEVLDSARDSVKELSTARQAIASRVKELVKSGAEKKRALDYVTKEEFNLPQMTLEARQSLDALPKKIVQSPAGSALRKKFNASLDKIAPAVREADPAVGRAALGKEFLNLIPEGFSRRVIATAGLGGSVFNPPLIGPTLAFSPLATGVGTAAAGTASKAITGLSKTALRRALISAMASRANKEPDNE
jgi:BMFP domain-containing protein YqiC